MLLLLLSSILEMHLGSLVSLQSVRAARIAIADLAKVLLVLW
jgi:hypothetical protein